MTNGNRGGWRGGTRDFAAINAASSAARRASADARAAEVMPHIGEAQRSGSTSLREIASYLNRKGIATPRGKTWQAPQIKSLIDRYPIPEPVAPERRRTVMQNGRLVPVRSDIDTPLWGCAALYATIAQHYAPRVILDPCAGDGRLTAPWRTADPTVRVIEFELKDGRNFLDHADPIACDLVVCNPPFNGAGAGQLANEVWVDHIIELVGFETPVVMFTPMGFRLNLSAGSNRLAKLATKYPPITSIMSCPRDFFDPVIFHTEIIAFNMPKLAPHYVMRKPNQDA